MAKINFKQPKYIFPAIIFIPLVSLIYFVSSMFGATDEGENKLATDQINPELPDARAPESGDKLFEASRRFDDDESYTAVGGIDKEQTETEIIEQGYSEDELNRLDAEAAERIRQQKQLEDMQKRLADSRRHINTSGRSSSGGYGRGDYDYDSEDEYERQMQDIQNRSARRQKMLTKALGIPDPEEEAARERRRQDSIAHVREIERERNRPNLVLKSQDANVNRFNTVSGSEELAENHLIKAMIDQTTKASEGTRIRFKLLDNVTIKDITLPKGSYLYGTVTGFGQQRVKANITSILIGNRFVKVNLAVFDIDGMEGFYVPSSAFRDLMKDATASTIQQNISIDNGSSSSGFNAESLALQALQNIYNSTTKAISSNVRKNKAKIKYNTVVYLINSEDAR